LTGPWLPDGAFSSLEDVIRHHIDPEGSLASYDVGSTVGPDIQVLDQPHHLDRLLSSVGPELDAVPSLTGSQINELVAFLNALTDPDAADLGHLIPETVPSGLPVGGR
jgi:cytochrome c peroxidase